MRMDDRSLKNWESFPCILEVHLTHDPKCLGEESLFAMAPVVQTVDKVKKLV